MNLQTSEKGDFEIIIGHGYQHYTWMHFFRCVLKNAPEALLSIFKRPSFHSSAKKTIADISFIFFTEVQVSDNFI